MAAFFVSSELTKYTNQRTSNVIDALNHLNKKDPFDPSQAAFVSGTAPITPGKCRIGIALSGGGGVDLRTVTDVDTVTINGIEDGTATVAQQITYVVEPE